MLWVTSSVSVLAAVVVSPLLAGWTVALTKPASDRGSWWWPRTVSLARFFTVAGVAAVLAAGASRGEPHVAWWLFATGGAVLCVTDAEHHLLPARLVYPLAAAVFAALAMTEAVTGEPGR